MYTLFYFLSYILENRLSGEFERSDSVKSANRKISEDERTHRKDIQTYYGITVCFNPCHVDYFMNCTRPVNL